MTIATKITTKRLTLTVFTDEEVRALRDMQDDEEMRKAYGEMLDGCLADPANRVWYAPWKICLKDTKEFIGDAGFKGPVKNNAVEIGYGLLQPYWGHGYMTEACEALCNWAFENANSLFFIEAESEKDNTRSLRVLMKKGFVPYGEGEEGPRFVKERPVSSYWLGVYMCLGVAIGMLIGMLIGKVYLGPCFGLPIGVAIGTSIDNRMKKEFEQAKEERKKRLG